MKKKKGFTLIELLAVVVVLGLTFLFVGPKLVSLIKEGENTETELIEERILSAAKDYVNNIDGTFYAEFLKTGDTNYIYKTDLLKTGLITEEDLSKLDTIAGVKGELLEDDKMRYTIEYINADPSEYTNEELYTMFKNLNERMDNLGSGSGDSGNIDSSVIDDLQSQINEVNTKADKNTTAISNISSGGSGVDASVIQNLESKIDDNTTLINTNTTLINQYSTNVSNLTNVSNSNNVFLKTYPVGSMYISSSSTNPGTIFGGTWKLVNSDYERHHVGSQVIYDGLSGNGLVSKTSVIGAYNLYLITGLFNNYSMPEGYHREYRLTFNGTTGGDNDLKLYLNNIGTNGLHTWSANTYRTINTSNYFKEEDVVLETTHGYSNPGINLKYEVTGGSSSWQFWNVTIHAYAVKDTIDYKWQRTA